MSHFFQEDLNIFYCNYLFYPSARGYNWATLFLGDIRVYIYRDLALQVGGVSNEIVKYGREFCGNSTQE
jgi:hypothetical protein